MPQPLVPQGAARPQPSQRAANISAVAIRRATAVIPLITVEKTL